jgi:ATP-binding cassette subfamily B multidrug efflux pump
VVWLGESCPPHVLTEDESPVLIRLLRTYLRPYRKPLAFLLVLQLAQTLATLYLPTLNADIIDNGVIRHNTHYILTTGGVMLAITLAQIVCAIGAIYFGAQVAMALGRDVRQGSSAGC